jgi:uncharacterized protein YjbI with pentapeptide repeats
MRKQKETSQQSILHQFLRVLFGLRSGNAKEQTRPKPVLPPPPTTDDPKAWADYFAERDQAWIDHWQKQGQSWRNERVIDEKRQNVLNECRSKRLGWYVYPFSEIEPKLTRADIEWLLATHENGRGPVDWRDFSQREREGLDLRGANLSSENLDILPLTRMCGSYEGRIFFGTEQQLDKTRVHLEWTKLQEAHLEGANLSGAYLAHADLRRAYLEEADLFGARLEGTNLDGAHLEGANLQDAHLEGASFRGAFFDTTTNLKNVTLGNEKMGFASLADVHWGDVNLSVIDWAQVKMLGEERLAWQANEHHGNERIKNKRLDRFRETRLEKFKVAVRVNRQLASVLRDRGLSEEANHFAYRSQILQRIVFRLQTFESGVKLRQRVRMFFSWIGSGFLDLLAGYGYRPGRSIRAYLIIIFGFMGLYLLISLFACPHLRWDEALVLSVSSFHGRGFFSQDITLGDAYARLAAAEAVVGLLIEISFIATFTYRFFGK